MKELLLPVCKERPLPVCLERNEDWLTPQTGLCQEGTGRDGAAGGSKWNDSFPEDLPESGTTSFPGAVVEYAVSRWIPILPV